MILQEKDYLEIYKKENEAHLGWGSSSEWTNQDFEKLCELVFEKTGVRLSASTLKRVWGKVKYDSAPTLTTLNTLAQFSGYENWRNFRSQVQAKFGNTQINGNGVPKTEIELQIKPATAPIPSEKKTSSPSVWKLAIPVVLSIAVTILYFNLSPRTRIDHKNIEFLPHVLSDDLPNSVVFDFNVGNTRVDSVLIQQSWDPRRREKVPARNKQHTSIYYYPGVFQAKLIVDDQIVKQENVYIQTKGWKGIIAQEPVPTYLASTEIGLHGNSMRIDAETLSAKTGKVVFNGITTGFYNLHSYDSVDPFNFTMKATLRNTSSREQAVCQNAGILLIGENEVISVPLCGKGCTSAISAYIAGVSINGKETDLSAFGCDFSKAQEIKFVVVNNHLKIILNDTPIYNFPNPVNMGRIEGAVVTFEGTGELLDLEIK